MAIKYVVVVMLENRSYDNMLGSLYNPNNDPPYEYQPPGQSNLNGLGANNLNPTYPKAPNTTPVLAHNETEPTVDSGSMADPQQSYPATTIPIYDPGEWFGDMAQQITGSPKVPTTNPYSGDNAYNPQNAGDMQGFTLNYQALGSFPEQVQPPIGNVPDVMNYFTPAQLPVTSFLANNYGVCDQWFASVPSQTYVNRAFALTGGPGLASGNAWVNDVWYLSGPQLVPSLLWQLDTVKGATPPQWKVYFHDYSIAYDTVAYVANTANGSSNQNVCSFDDSDYNGGAPGQFPAPAGTTFVQDLTAKDGPALPPFSFIEPRYFLTYAPLNGGSNYNAPNSNHPGVADYLHLFEEATDHLGSNNPPIDVMSGELFLMELYNALQASSIWPETLLIITYDEHGGVYDHVPPPPATPPVGWDAAGSGTPFPSAIDIPPIEDTYDPAASNFGFNVMGGRVPAIIVSPLIAPGSTIRDAGGLPFDHTSIIKTAWELFGLTSPSSDSLTSLTQRDAAAPSLVPFLNGNNQTGRIPEMILTAPSFFVFTTATTKPVIPSQVLYASTGGSTALTVSPQANWISAASLTPQPGLSPGWTIALVTANLPSSTTTSSIEIKGGNLEVMTIPVTVVIG